MDWGGGSRLNPGQGATQVMGSTSPATVAKAATEEEMLVLIDREITGSDRQGKNGSVRHN